MNIGEIRKVCVIGAGTMGGAIAAHLINLGFEVSLLDETQEDVLRGIDRLKQTRPPAFYLPERISEIRVGNVVDHLHFVGEADWVCEAIAERFDAKQALFAKIEPILKPDALISSNTSGIPLETLSADRSPSFQERFLGIHFFNPPRYLKLIELIPTSLTSPAVARETTKFLETKLARRVVVAKDVPGFIANRFGMWSLFHAIHTTEKLGLTIEQVDALTGLFLGRPKTGTFRLADVIGLDVMRDIADNLKSSLPGNPYNKELELPSSMLSLLARGWLGDKASHGYYRREGRDLFVLDLNTFAYRLPRETDLPDFEALHQLPLKERLRSALVLKSEVGEFLREYLAPTLAYAESINHAVCHSVKDFDRVMRWGFAWDVGPFQMLDDIGPVLDGSVERPRYFRDSEGGHHSGSSQEPEFARLSDFKELARGDTFVTRDLGDGVLAVALTTKLGIIGPQVVSELTAVFRDTFKCYVFTSESKVFSAGYDLKFLLESIQSGNLAGIEQELEALQNLGRLLESKPGSAAVFGYCLGAGLELAISAATVVASVETQIGLPESRVGLLPGGRGVALMKQHNSFNAKRLSEVSLTIAQGTVAANADVAKQLGYLRSTDRTVYDPDRLIHTAKAAALEATVVKLDWKNTPGPLVGMIDEGISRLKSSGAFTDHDELIAGKIRQIVARSVSFEDALQRERQEFLDLCGRNLTQSRIRHMLDQGTTLRN